MRVEDRWLATAGETDPGVLSRQLARQRQARRAAELIGDRTASDLRDTVDRLERAEQALQERVRIADFSYGLVRSLRSDLDPTRMMARAAAALGDELGVDRVLVRLTDGLSAGCVVTQWCQPGVDPIPSDAQMPSTMPVELRQHLDADACLWLEDIDEHPDLATSFRSANAQCRAYAGVPLMGGAQIVGWVSLHSEREPRQWSARDRTVTHTLASDLSGALLQARAYQHQIDMVRELREVDEIKNELVWRVSHELRTPLASIRGYTELLADGDLGEATPAQQRTLGVILRNCDRLLSLTENLVTLSHLDMDGPHPARQYADLNELVTCARDRVSATAQDKGIELGLEIADPAVLSVFVDRSNLERAVAELLANAVKFTCAGGQVTLRVETDGEDVVIEVRDDGPGIEPADRTRIFERFFRTRQAQAAEVPGAGLGLALVQSVVQAHGGRVDLATEPGEGSAFRLVLPRTQSTVMTAPAEHL